MDGTVLLGGVSIPGRVEIVLRSFSKGDGFCLSKSAALAIATALQARLGCVHPKPRTSAAEIGVSHRVRVVPVEYASHRHSAGMPPARKFPKARMGKKLDPIENAGFRKTCLSCCV